MLRGSPDRRSSPGCGAHREGAGRDETEGASYYGRPEIEGHWLYST